MVPRVSILLPTHNKAELVGFAIRSVLAQSFRDFELLVAGDGCTDGTAKVVQGFNDPRISWYDLPKAPNFGYANRNLVLRKAKGDLIAFMAHDDLWLSDHLEIFLPVFHDPGVEIAYSRPLWIIPGGLIVPGIVNLDHRPSLAYFLEVGNKIPAGCFIHRRECLLKYGYWDENLPRAGDWDLWKRIITGGGGRNFAYLDTPTCLHFKADWHNNDYDAAFKFPEWRNLFKSGRMPTALIHSIQEDEIEQEVMWNAMSSNPAEWNQTIRSAIRQVIDILAFQGFSSIAGMRSHREGMLLLKNDLRWRILDKILNIRLVDIVSQRIRTHLRQGKNHTAREE